MDNKVFNYSLSEELQQKRIVPGKENYIIVVCFYFIFFAQVNNCVPFDGLNYQSVSTQIGCSGSVWFRNL